MSVKKLSSSKEADAKILFGEKNKDSSTTTAGVKRPRLPSSTNEKELKDMASTSAARGNTESQHHGKNDSQTKGAGSAAAAANQTTSKVSATYV